MYVVRVSIVEFIVENNVEYHYSTKYSTINPTIFNNGIKIKISMFSIGYFGISFSKFVPFFQIYELFRFE